MLGSYRDAHRELALTSEEFVTLEKSVVESVVKRERLNVKEVDLFKAVDRWATKEVERQGLTLDGVVKRRILGEETVKAIRFPVMSQKEFASVVVDCDILTKKEIGFMMKHYGGVGLESSLPFMHSPRQRTTGLLHRVYRFTMHSVTFSLGGWHYTGGRIDALNLTVNRPVTLQGVQHFGSDGGEYNVSLEVKDTKNGFLLIKQTGTYFSEKDESDVYYGFDVMFDHPVCLERGKAYDIVSLIKGPPSWYMTNGKESEEVQGIQFSFRRSSVAFGNVTDIKTGQFPAFIFSAM